ncbi:MAG TPA: 6-carboxytetrahydropterin synthase [Phycisphaerae bacterium]|jgi:6-pyruvoyltetrahydropterin/6-carboxytetrahydropterin synthase|nr:6-carboxytetrahydropterin synthase [Phycisphaerae bacterium]
MLSIETTHTFSAAHALRLPTGGAEPLHGHDFHLTVRLAADTLDALETVLDFHLLESAVEKIIAPFRNANLNDLEPFRAGINPSAERIAEHIAMQLQRVLPTLDATAAGRHLRLTEVRLTEAPNCLAIWTPD